MKKTILLIDDDNMILMLLEKTLKDNGYDVYISNTGERGLEIIKERVIDLIITDYDIPNGMSGIDVLKIVKHNYNIPIIMFTAFDDAALIIKSMQLGACDYIEKPIPSDVLLECIENVLNDGSCAKIRIDGSRYYR